MLRLRVARLALGFLVFPVLVLGGCGARTGLLVDEPPSDAATPPPASVSGKVDLLFMIDNSGSMGDKQALLRDAVPDLIHRLVSPNCIDAAGKIVGGSTNGTCTSGTLEFRPVPDIHIAIVTSSMGGRGSDACGTGANPVHPELMRHNDDRGRLINRGGEDEHVVAEASPSNFLAWLPNVPANRGNPKPPVAAIDDANVLVSRFQDLVDGVTEFGCGFEAQLESFYHFLIQPDPYDHIENNGDQAVLVGTDQVILSQRHDFLRPDSLLGVVVVTDENDSPSDPRANDGHAWYYENSTFPGSPSALAPRPTAACASAPLSDACMPCTSSPDDANCVDNGTYLTGSEDRTNVRFFHMKQRFGIDVQFPIDRYIDGLTSATVPDRNGEHPALSSAYVGTKNCTNPIFAAGLPTSASADLCHLPRGPRTPGLVYFAVIGGVPHQLLQQDPANPDSPQKDALSDADWIRILGKDPLHYDFTGIDPHMIESITPRAGLPPVDAPDNSDPIIGRESATDNNNLEFACTFTLATPRDCAAAAPGTFCDCIPSNIAPSSLCDPANPTVQLRGKAYPTVRELAVAKALGDRASVSSLCPIHIQESSKGDPLYGYRPAISGIVDAIRKGLVK